MIPERSDGFDRPGQNNLKAAATSLYVLGIHNNFWAYGRMQDLARDEPSPVSGSDTDYVFSAQGLPNTITKERVIDARTELQEALDTDDNTERYAAAATVKEEFKDFLDGIGATIDSAPEESRYTLSKRSARYDDSDPETVAQKRSQLLDNLYTCICHGIHQLEEAQTEIQRVDPDAVSSYDELMDS